MDVFFLQSGCLKMYDKTPQRRNSIGRYAGILGTIGMYSKRNLVKEKGMSLLSR